MESNKKCKVQEKAYSEQRQTNYKNLRKEKEEEKKSLQKETERNESRAFTRRTAIDLTCAMTEETKKRKLENSEKYLAWQQRMVSASIHLQRGKVVQDTKREQTTAATEDRKVKSPQREISVLAVQKPNKRPNFKELAAENLI